MVNDSLQISLKEFRTKGTDLKKNIYVSTFKNEPFIINSLRSYQADSDILVQIRSLI